MYVWKEVFNYPVFLLRPIGLFMIIAVIMLNVSPPPGAYGNYSCFFFCQILGGGIYTWFINYRSPKQSILVFVCIFLLCILSSNDITGAPANKIEVNARTPGSPLSKIFSAIFLPLVMGFMGGPAFLKIGKIEAEMSKDKK